jgi:Lipase
MYGDYNVINVVWGKGAQGTYLQAAVNTLAVALEVGHVIKTLRVSTLMTSHGWSFNDVEPDRINLE